jgi:hypothetical protein
MSSLRSEAGGCDPRGDPQVARCALANAYGVFVAASGADDTGGTEGDPFRTIGEGVALA